MKKALVIIDLQQGVCYGEETLYNLDHLIQRVNARIEAYRKLELPIIFIQHEDEDLIPQTDTWALHPTLANTPEDYYVAKTHANSFYHTELQKVLDKEQVTDLEIWGAQTQYCMDSTIKFAHGLGYKLFMKPGGSSTVSNEFMSAAQTIGFYENIWRDRFVTITD